MIRKVRNKKLWNIYSETTGKKLNKKPFKSLKKAKERLREIEYFKKKSKK